MRKTWDGKALKELIKLSGLTEEEFAAEMGIKRSTLRQHANGVSAPSFTWVCRYAEFFGVTLDEIAGFVKRGDTQEYFNGEHKEIIDALERKYKRKLDKHGIREEKVREDVGNDFYPHNLLADIFESEYDKDMRFDAEGLEYAIGLLSEKEKDMTSKRYRGNLTLKEIGEQYGITRERVRQVVARALRKLRHPLMKEYITKGTEYVLTAQGQREAEAILSAKEEMLKSKERRLEMEEEKLEKVEKGIRDRSKEAGLGDISSISNLHLSRRAYNWLKRGIRINGELFSISTIGELEAVASNGLLLNIRNIGVKTADEICEALYWKTGKDYRRVNGIATSLDKSA